MNKEVISKTRTQQKSTPQKNKKNGISSKTAAIAVIFLFLIVLVMYFAGLFSQLISKDTKTEKTKWGDPVSAGISIDLNPVESFKYTFTKNGLYFMGAIISISVSVVIIFKAFGHKGGLADDRGFYISEKGTYGTSGWMEPLVAKEVLDLKKVEDTSETILGSDMDETGVYSNKEKSRLNKHISIYGASGTGKSRCFVFPQIIQCAERGESIIVTDPKGELFGNTATYLRNKGYDVKAFNLVNAKNSDSWACLHEILTDTDQIELLAQVFADVIIKNTSSTNKGGDEFWSQGEMNLLKALCLYIATSDMDDIAKNLGAVYELISTTTQEKLTAMFDSLPATHPAKKPWSIFKQASDNVKGNLIVGLGSRLQVFQSPDICKITTYPEIDLEKPAKEKCAFFVIMSDQNSSLDFLASLFFSFLFIRLVGWADTIGGGKCKVPVNFILDEFPNIGQIPDFCKKLSTIRSRDLRVAVIFQTISQLQNRYPNNLWEEIIGNCDTQLFLGCTDSETANFISKRTGEMTVEVNSQGVKKNSLSPVNYSPSYSETSSVGKRVVLTPDEVMRLPLTQALLILRGQKVLKVKKFDISQHPGNANFTFSSQHDYIPQWRKEMTKGNKTQQSEQEIIDARRDIDFDEDIFPEKKSTRASQLDIVEDKKSSANQEIIMSDGTKAKMVPEKNIEKERKLPRKLVVQDDKNLPSDF